MVAPSVEPVLSSSVSSSVVHAKPVTAAVLDDHDSVTSAELDAEIDNDFIGRIEPKCDTAIKQKWSRRVGPGFEIIVSPHIMHLI